MSELRQGDYFQDGVPRHKLSYCAFMDVLGFSDQIKASFEQEAGDELLERFHAVLSKRLDAMREECEESSLYFKSFTDNIILAHPQFSHDLESEFGFILWSITRFQILMALEGFFIRGGLSVGPLFMDENSVYGPALLEAYSLESKVAVNPAIVLSDDVMMLVAQHVKFYASTTIAPQNRDVWVNPDGRFFLNYLSECIIDTGEDEIVDWDALKVHRDRIEEKLKAHMTEPQIFAKYVWLSSYHNEFCRTVSRYPDYDSDIRIKPSKYKVRFARLSQLGI